MSPWASAREEMRPLRRIGLPSAQVDDVARIVLSRSK